MNIAGTHPSILVRLVSVLLCLAAAGFIRAETVRYTHDTAGRLTSVHHGQGRSIHYVYDPAGNLQARKIVVITDSDEDGMEDQWELDHFETLARDGTLDLDLDGLTDLEEYLAGTDPDDPASALRVLVVELSGTVPVRESIRVNDGTATVSWTSVPGEAYQVQSVDGLEGTNWMDLGPEVIATTSLSSVTDGGLLPQRFYRVMRAGAVPASYATLRWTAVPGRTYRVQFKQDVTDPFWTDLVGLVTAETGVASKVDVTPEAPRRLYRVVLLP